MNIQIYTFHQRNEIENSLVERAKYLRVHGKSTIKITSKWYRGWNDKCEMARTWTKNIGARALAFEHDETCSFIYREGTLWNLCLFRRWYFGQIFHKHGTGSIVKIFFCLLLSPIGPCQSFSFPHSLTCLPHHLSFLFSFFVAFAVGQWTFSRGSYLVFSFIDLVNEYGTVSTKRKHHCG